MKLKKWYFRDTLASDFYFVEAKTIRGALTKIKKNQLLHVKSLAKKTTFWTIFEGDTNPSNIRCILVTYVFPNGDIKQDVL